MKRKVRLSLIATRIVARLTEQGRYADAYDVIVDDTKGRRYDGRIWFEAAAGVNRGIGYASAFIRTYTQIAWEDGDDQKMVLNNQKLQEVSDAIAKTVLERIVERHGILPSLYEVFEIDAETVIRELNIKPFQWAGTPIGFLYGFKGPVPREWPEWVTVLRATEQATVSALYGGTRDYVKSLFGGMTTADEDAGELVAENE